MDIKIIKELGHGLSGTVYLAESGKRKFIYKIEKYVLSEKSLLGTRYWRQVYFNGKVACYHPDKFMTLISHGVIYDCEHKQPIPKHISKELELSLKEKNKLTTCYYLMYKPILQQTWLDARDKIFSSKKKWYGAMYKIIEQVDIMRRAGFSHRDIHEGNVMVSGDTIMIIDYGLIVHPKFDKNYDDVKLGLDKCTDLIDVLFTLSITNPAVQLIAKKNMQIPKADEYLKAFSKHPEYNSIIKYLPKTTAFNRRSLIEFLMSILDYDYYKKCIGAVGPEFDNLKAKIIDLDILLKCVQHSADKDYSYILKLFKKHMK